MRSPEPHPETASIPLPGDAPARSDGVVHPGELLTRRRRLAYVLVLGALTALGPFTIDLYLPAFPDLVEELRTTEGFVQLTLTATAVGFGIGQLFVGPWSDAIGRRIPLLVATSVHILASLAVFLAPTIELIGVARVVQGIGAAAGAVVALAMVRDLFGGKPLVRMLSRLALVSGLAPVLAPVLGSQLLLVMDWRGIFVSLAGYSVVLLIAVALFVVETLPPERRRASGHDTVRSRFAALFRDRIFLGSALIGGAVFSVILSYVSSSPFLVQTLYGADAQQFGLLFGVNSAGLFVAVQVSARLIRRYGPQWVLAFALPVILFASVALIVLAPLDLGLVSVAAPFFVLVTACGACFPCFQVLALAGHGTEAGTAASITGAANSAVAGVVSGIPGALGLSSGAPVGLVCGVASVFAILVLWFVVRPWTVPPLGD